jgi:anti-sigma factor ChrR (cupin superfamily)
VTDVHLNDDRLRAFAAGSLAPGDLLDVDDHLAGCDSCRARLTQFGASAAALDDLSGSLREPVVHLTEEDVLLLAQGRVPPEQAFVLRRHLVECEPCQRQVAELSAWIRSPRLRWPAIAAAAAAAVLAIAVLSARMWYSQPTVHQAAAGQDVLQSLSPVARAQVEAAYRTGTADLPAFVRDLTPPRETLMGKADTSSGFEIVGPVGTAVVEDAPIFTWHPLAGAGGYVVTVFDENGTEAARSPAVTVARWTPASALPRNHTYTWQVSAEQNGQSRIAPAPPAPPARFRVLDAETVAELRRVAREFPEAHDVLGVLYMEAGVRAEAMAELGKVRPDDPHADVARKSLARLQAAEPHSR